MNFPLVLPTLLEGNLNLTLRGALATLEIRDSKGYILTEDLATCEYDPEAYVVSVV